MADKLDPTEEKLSLSMPSLRRRRRKRSEAPPAPAPTADPPRDSGAEDTAVLPEVPAARQPDAPADVTDSAETAETVGSSAGLASGPIPGAPSPPVAAARTHPEHAASASEPATVTGEPAKSDEAAGSAPWRQRVDLVPMLPGKIAALVTGAVVGLTGTALTYAGLQGCSSVRGTSTCGTPGFILLFAILVIMVLLGSVLLTVWQVEGAGSASVLGVGLSTVLVILFLTDVIFSPWMFLVVPVVGALAFLGSWWVTTHFADEPTESWQR